MGLQDKLTTQGSPLSKNDGGINSIMQGSLRSSKLHDEYSINGNPNVTSNPNPSDLDLNGRKPSNSYDVTAPPEGLGRI